MSRTRAKSPPPPPPPLPLEYENMSVDEVEMRLGKTIPRLPPTLLQKLIRKTPEPVPDALDAAKRHLYDHEFHLHRLELEKNSAGQKASSAPKAAEPLFNYDAHYHKSDRPKNCPMNPISIADLLAAEMQVRHIEMNHPRYDYVVYSNALKVATDHLASLQRQFDEQELRCPGAHKHPRSDMNLYELSAPPLPPSKMSSYPPDSGGKSKRVKRTKTCKSKRSKRSKTCKNRVHKRRN